MDKKNVLIGILLIAGALAVMMRGGPKNPELGSEPKHTAPTESITSNVGKTESTNSLFVHTQEAPQETGGLFEKVGAAPDIQPTTLNEELYTLENDVLKVRFTTRGGAIKDVAFKKFPATQTSDAPFIFNDDAALPSLAISMTGPNGQPREYAPEYRLRTQEKGRILFETQTPEGVKIYRGYSLSFDKNIRDPYLIKHETRFLNNSKEAFNLKKIYLSMGALPPTKGDTLGEYLNIGYYNGKDAEFIKSNKFEGSKGILGFGAHSPVATIEESVHPIVWGSVKNQFFASVLTPDEPATGIYASKANVNDSSDPESQKQGVMGNLEMELGQIEAGKERLLSVDYYIGPKEYTRLEALGQKQDLVMQFGFFGLISKFLLVAMRGVNNFIPNWGLTIIVVTFIIKMILWPLTAIQVRSSKRMAQIQGPLKEIKEKYKDNPQKVQAETMKLFKAHRVNPAAGCLPLFVQLPIFLGLYFMLRTSSELRFAEFLWISDLSLPDTVGYISGFAINILPLIMAISMFFQMRMTPSPSADGTQQKIMQFMPFIFLIFCYNFPSGLVLYWTVQNIFTIAQQVITNKMKDPAVDIIPAATKGKKKKTQRG